MEKKKASERILENRIKLVEERNKWQQLYVYGGNDPAWPDGVNLNLIRNHILDYRREIMEICESEQWSLPEEYYFPVPPEVDNGYMANLNQKERVERIKKFGMNLTVEKKKFDDKQGSFL